MPTKPPAKKEKGALGDVKGALTRKFGPLPAWAWLAGIAVAVYWFRSRSSSATGAATASGNAGDTGGGLGDFGGTDGGSSGGAGSSGGDGSGATTPGKPKKKIPVKRPKKRHHKPRAKAKSKTKIVHRPKQTWTHESLLPPVHHPRHHAPTVTKKRTPVRRVRPS